MRFAVLWSEDALAQLAQVWLEASDRQRVTAAQAAIDAELARDPLARAVHVSEGLYRLRCAPLQVLFELDEHNRQVRVTAVRRFAEV